MVDTYRVPISAQSTRLPYRLRMRVALVCFVLFFLWGCEVAYPDGKYVCGDNFLCPRGLECRTSENLCYKKTSKIDEGGDVEVASEADNYVPPCNGKKALEMLCDGRTLYQCDENNDAVAWELCDSEAMCLAGTRGFGCGRCEPDSYACDGQTLQKCDQTGQYSPTPIKKFDTVYACKEELKRLGGACKVGQFKCIGDIVYKCSADQTAFEEDPSVDPCEIGFCNELLGKCNR
jgi:hypothetical protein